MSTDARVATVLDVLRGHESATAAAARLGVSRQTIHNWQSAFVAGGVERLARTTTHATLPPPGADHAELSAAVASIVGRLRALNDGHELDIDTMEAIRTGASLPVGQFCEVVGVARRTYHARRSTAAATAPASRLVTAIRTLRAAHPDWGARRIWRHLPDAGGPQASLATVKRTLAREP